MKDGAYLIGRGPELAYRPTAIRLNHSTVSQRHAELFVINGTYYLADLGSRNGTWRVGDNGDERLSEAEVDLDDLLRFGEMELRLRDLIAHVETSGFSPTGTQ